MAQYNSYVNKLLRAAPSHSSEGIFACDTFKPFEISFQLFNNQSCSFREPNMRTQPKQKVQCSFLWKHLSKMEALFRELRKLMHCLLLAHNHRASIRKRTKMNLLFPCGTSANSYTKFAFNLTELTASPWRLVNQALSPGVSLLLGCLKMKPFPKSKDINIPCLNFLFCQLSWLWKVQTWKHREKDKSSL